MRVGSEWRLLRRVRLSKGLSFPGQLLARFAQVVDPAGGVRARQGVAMGSWVRHDVPLVPRLGAVSIFSHTIRTN